MRLNMTQGRWQSFAEGGARALYCPQPIVGYRFSDIEDELSF
jgi:hypothetical protein